MFLLIEHLIFFTMSKVFLVTFCHFFVTSKTLVLTKLCHFCGGVKGAISCKVLLVFFIMLKVLSLAKLC